jgi:hypothetical protein
LKREHAAVDFKSLWTKIRVFVAEVHNAVFAAAAIAFVLIAFFGGTYHCAARRDVSLYISVPLNDY